MAKSKSVGLIIEKDDLSHFFLLLLLLLLLLPLFKWQLPDGKTPWQ